MRERQQSTTTFPVAFLLVSSTDHVTAITGATPTVNISKNGAAFGGASGAVTELANGWYSWAGNATDRGTLGGLAVHITAASADPADFLLTIVPWDPFDSNLALARLDAAVSTRLATSGYTAPDNADIATILGRTDVATSTRSSHSAADVWAVGTRTLTGFGTLIADIWASATRTLTAFGFGVTASSVTDKTGYALTVGEHTAIAADAQTGLTAQGYTSTRAGYLDTLNGLVQAIWDKATSALTAAGSAGKLLVDNLNATVGSRLATSGYTAPDNTSVGTILTRTDVATSTRLATTGYAVPPTANENADAVLDRADAVETGVTPRGSLRLMLAALAGKLSGASGTTVTIRNVGDTKDRITATVDSSGDRTAVTTDAS